MTRVITLPPCPICQGVKLNMFSHFTCLGDGMIEIPKIQCCGCKCEADLAVWPRRRPTPAETKWAPIDALRAPEGNTVTLVYDNPDFNGQPDCLVECCGDWTGYDTQRFAGDTVLDALMAAYLKMIMPALDILLPADRSKT